MTKLTGHTGGNSGQRSLRWLRLRIPGTEAEATYPIPAECEEYFDDSLHPPSVLFFARAVLDTTAKIFNKSGAPDYQKSFPDKVKVPSYHDRIREWKRLIEITEVDRRAKRSRLLKEAGAARCRLSPRWEEHPDWSDLPEAPAGATKTTRDEEKWRRWAKERGKPDLKLVK
jgi:hypothetical protein